MKKRIKEFCESQDVDRRWELLCQIESKWEYAQKSEDTACLVSAVCAIPGIVLVWLKILWTFDFFVNVEESPLQRLLSDLGFLSWSSVLTGLGVSCLCAAVIGCIVFRIRFSAWRMESLPVLSGDDGQKAREIARKAEALTKKPDESSGGGIGLLIFGGTFALAVTHGIDQSGYAGSKIWEVLFSIIFSGLLLAIPVGFTGFLCSFIVLLPVDVCTPSVTKETLKQISTNADSEWLRLDRQEVLRREELTQRQRDADEAFLKRHFHKPTSDDSDSRYSHEKGYLTYHTDSRTGKRVYYKDGQYLDENGERVPFTVLEEGY